MQNSKPSKNSTPAQPVYVRTVNSMSQYQPIRVAPKPRRRSLGCATPGCILLLLLPVILILAVYLLAPMRTNLLLMGIDRPPEGTNTSRTDTMILFSVDPLKPDIEMLSVPRDLWVSIPGVGENRLNTAHFFAEANNPGSGPRALAQTIEENFGISVNYTIRIRFDDFVHLIDSMGGIDLTLDSPTGGLTAGKYHLNGTQALAFARDRKGADDFFRMADGQIMVKAVLQQVLRVTNWPRIPFEAITIFKAMDTNVPAWQWPRLLLAFLRAGPSGIHNQVLPREMVTGYITDEGADVLLPNWDLIRPFVANIFGK
jgi:polyisoprenyl-teichoic acid--peptidoglycan teichoic acid transferase